MFLSAVASQKPEKPVVIKLQPICDVAAALEEKEKTSHLPKSPTSPESLSEDSNSVSPSKQFAVVKRNTIKLKSLPQSVEKLRSRGPTRKGAHSSRNNSVKVGERKRSLSLGLKYKSRKGPESRRKLNVGSTGSKIAGPTGCYPVWEKRLATNAAEAKEVSTEQHRIETASNVLVDTALVITCKLPEESDTSPVEESEVEGSNVLVTTQTSPEVPSPTKLNVEYSTENQFSKEVIKESRMETLNEEPTPRTSRCLSREYSTDDMFSISVGSDMFSFKDELLKRATACVCNEKEESQAAADVVQANGDNQEKNEEENESKDLKQEEKHKEAEKPSVKDTELNGIDVHDLKEEENDSGKEKASVNDTRSTSIETAKDNVQDSKQKEKCKEEEKPSVNGTLSTSTGTAKDKSVQKLKNKFLKIDDMIDAKHKNNLAKKNLEIQKELRSVSMWTNQTSSTLRMTRKKSVNTSEVSKRELSGCRRSIKQLTAMYLNEVEKDKKKGKRKKGPHDLPRERTGSDTSSSTTERSESTQESESWSRRTSVSSRGGSILEEGKAGEESSELYDVPEHVAEVSTEAFLKISEELSEKNSRQVEESSEVVSQKLSREVSEEGNILAKEDNEAWQSKEEKIEDNEPTEISQQAVEEYILRKDSKTAEETSTWHHPVLEGVPGEGNIRAKKDNEDASWQVSKEEKAKDEPDEIIQRVIVECVLIKDGKSAEETSTWHHPVSEGVSEARKVCLKEEKDSEDASKQISKEENVEDEPDEISQQVVEECILRKDIKSFEKTPHDRDLENFPPSSLPKFKIHSPRPGTSSNILPEPSKEPVSASLGKELMLEIVFPTDGETSSLQRNAASHDSGIDIVTCSTSHSPSGLEPCMVGEEINAVFPTHRVRPPLVRQASLNGAENDMPVFASGDEGDLSAGPLSPGSDVSPTLFWPQTQYAGSVTSLEDTGSSCNTPRMSIVIAQERSSTKINSRFFSLETCDHKVVDEYQITEERSPGEVMDVEGEFCFGQERSHLIRAEREAIFSLRRDSKTKKASEHAIKEDEISIPPWQIEAQIQALTVVHNDLEKRGVEIEKVLRESMDCEYDVGLMQ